MTVIYVERESHTSDARFSALTVKDKDDNQRVIGSDYPLPSADVNHVRLHEGRAFASYLLYPPSAKLAQNATANMVISTGVSISPHIILQASCDQNAIVYFYENVTVNSGGTLFVPINRNRVSTTAATSGILLNPTLTINDGVIYEEYLAAGDSKKAAGASAYSFEYVLKTNTSYLFRLTNVGTTSATTFMSLEWYE
jgi:hypothetical protein